MNEVLGWFAVFFFIAGLVFFVGGDRMDSKPLIVKGAIFMVVSFILHYVNHLVG